MGSGVGEELEGAISIGVVRFAEGRGILVLDHTAHQIEDIGHKPHRSQIAVCQSN